MAKGRDGHYLLSGRHTSTIYKINGTDGAVIWRLGGRRSDFALGDGVRFGFQHHARYLVEDPAGARDVVTLFDNSVYGSESAGGRDKEVRVNPWSRGKYLALDHAANTATLVRALEPPAVLGVAPAAGDPPILTKSQGSLQTLPGGGALVNWGSEGQITEYDAAGGVVFHAFLGRDFLRTRLQNYRAFRFNWTGLSPETPAVLAEQSAVDGTVRLFVSWNGDTVTKTWRFTWAEESPAAGAGGAAATVWRDKAVARRGFETSTRIVQPSGVRISSVQAEALDAAGRVLGVSAQVGVQRALTREMVPDGAAPAGQKTLGGVGDEL